MSGEQRTIEKCTCGTGMRPGAAHTAACALSKDQCDCAARYGRPWHHRDCPASGAPKCGCGLILDHKGACAVPATGEPLPLVERLREWSTLGEYQLRVDIKEAADTIERLTRELEAEKFMRAGDLRACVLASKDNDRLRAALRKISDYEYGQQAQIAREALAETDLKPDKVAVSIPDERDPTPEHLLKQGYRSGRAEDETKEPKPYQWRDFTVRGPCSPSSPETKATNDPEPMRPDHDPLKAPFGTLNPICQAYEWDLYEKAMAEWKARQAGKTEGAK